MGTGRDDFTKDTIRKAAGRVGYRCSFPNCPNATIGASMESPNKTSVTGVAAHICAAAEGGPRYDQNMSVDERRSVENCIWLCQTHSKLIDTDVETYTVEKLHQWKADAELAASKALADEDYFGEYYKGNGDNLDILKQLFDDMITEGQFSQLRTMLAQYKDTLSEQYEEFVLRYKIAYDAYCDRAQLKNHLDAYCNLSCKRGVTFLVELFLSFHLADELGRVIEFCESEPHKKYAQMALSNELIKLLVAPVGSAKTVEIPKELNDVIQKYLTNHIVRSKMIGTIDVTGAKYAVFSDEFYYHAVSAAYELACATIYGKGNFEDIFNGSDFLFIKDNIEKITLLDISLQEYIWGKLLSFLSEKPEQFKIYYELCPLVLKTAPEITKAYYIYKISSDPNSIDCNNLLTYVSDSGEDPILCLYLSCIGKDAAIEFLDEHGFLFKRNSIFLKLKLDLLGDIKHEDACVFLNKYKEIYQDDFTFHVLLTKYSTSIDTINEEINWLNTNRYEIKSHDAIDYIRILRKHQRWADLAEFSQCHLPNEYVFAVAGYLSESEDENFVKVSCTLYQKLVDLDWKRKGLYFNFGVVHRQLSHPEEAKAYFQKEFDLFEDMTSLAALIQLRYSLNEYLTDGYFDELKRCVDAHSQNLVAAIYMKRCNYPDARKYFLRSLLLKEADNPSINGFCQTVAHLPPDSRNTIGENTFCVLKSNDIVRHIAIHEADVMDNITSPNAFAGYTHYSVQDVRISSLLFAVPGDSVELDGVQFEVAEIMSANEAIKRFFFSTLSNRKGVTVISSSGPEDFRDQLIAIMQKSSEDLRSLIDEYNQLEIRSPLSLFATATGKGRLKTCEFLAYENRERIRNNTTSPGNTEEPPVFVLSYETIVYLTHLGLDGSALSELGLMCSSYVKNQLLNDINEELSEITDDNQKATMFFEGGKLSLLERTSDMRRARYAFLSRLKAFVESLKTANHLPAFSSCSPTLKDDIESTLSKNQLYCESTSLSATKNTNNAVLVADDQFLFSLATMESISNTGLTGMLAHTNLSWDKLLSVSKKLKEMNYGNYLPIHLYKRIVDQMLAHETDVEKASAEIQAWVASDTDDDPTAHHGDVVITLYKDIVEQNLDYLNPESFLMDIALSIWEKRNPGFIKKCIADVFGLSADEIE